MIVELAEALGMQLVVTLGALLADVPHTPAGLGHRLRLRPDPGRAAGLDPSSYEGPTGIVGVLHAACQQAGLPSASLWAAVPHYIAAAPNPKAALALVRKLEGLVGVAVDASELETAAADYERQVNARGPERPRRAGVRRAARAGCRRARTTTQRELPSGDTIARDLQRFLRQRGDGTPGTRAGLTPGAQRSAAGHTSR